MPNPLIHTILLIIIISLSFIIPKTNLVQYDIQIFALLFIFLFLAKRFIPRTEGTRLIESIVFTFVILLIITTTGGLESPFFFLLYFLLFSLSLLLEPIISITTTFALIIFFLLMMPQGESFKELLPLFSLAFLTPFALFMGQEHIQIQKAKVKIQKSKEDTFLFLSLMIKNHVKNIQSSIDNYIGDHQLKEIKDNANRIEKLIDGFEKQNP
jgi:hypothetical protein